MWHNSRHVPSHLFSVGNKKKGGGGGGGAGMNKRETVEDFRQSPHIHGQSLAEHKDALLLASTWESVA